MGVRRMVLALVAAAVALGQVGNATETPYTAQYQIVDAEPSGDYVQVVLLVRVQNNTHSHALSATVALVNGDPGDEDPEEPDDAPVQTFGRFPAFDLDPHSATRTMRDRFVITPAEYDRWTSGEPPVLQMAFHDNDGVRRRKVLSLISVSNLDDPASDR